MSMFAAPITTKRRHGADDCAPPHHTHHLDSHPLDHSSTARQSQAAPQRELQAGGELRMRQTPHAGGEGRPEKGETEGLRLRLQETGDKPLRRSLRLSGPATGGRVQGRG